MRAICILSLLALAAVQSHAALVSVTGQGVIMNPPPSNVFAVPTVVNGVTIDDLDGPRDGSNKLLIGAFNEKRVTLTQNFQLTPSILLLANKTYDSHFLFHHVQSTKPGGDAALATYTLDNRFIGCTSSNNEGDDGAYEVSSTPIFGLDNVLYPNTTLALRGFEGGDLANGAGTQVTINSNIGQPGDFTRCISISCVDSAGEDCQCNVLPAGYAATCASGSTPLCFSSPAAFLPNASFTSTCPDIQADQESLLLTLDTCNAADGCTPHGAGGFCLQPLDFFAKVSFIATAACGCQTNIAIELPICGGCDFKTVSTSCVAASASSTGSSTGLVFDSTVPATQC